MAFDFVPKIVYDAGAGDVTISYDHPPRGFDSEGISIKAEGRVTQSAGGKLQTLNLFNEEERTIAFEMVTEAIKDATQTFMTTHALLGKSFSYFPHKDEAGSEITVKLAKTARRFAPQKMVPALRFRFDIRMRRVL